MDQNRPEKAHKPSWCFRRMMSERVRRNVPSPDRRRILCYDLYPIAFPLDTGGVWGILSVCLIRGPPFVHLRIV